MLNLQLDPKGITSAISGVEVDLANMSGTLTTSLATTTASTFIINADGNITGATAFPGAIGCYWACRTPFGK